VRGYPASSKLDLFEGWSRSSSIRSRRTQPFGKILVIFVTFDEGDGYYDSGYIQTFVVAQEVAMLGGERGV
jgi:phospholipase C